MPETLASNSKKAAYVHMVQIDNRIQRTNRLWKALINMHSLHDLRIRTKNDTVVGAWIEPLNIILWSVYNFRPFQLTDDLLITVKVIFD